MRARSFAAIAVVSLAACAPKAPPVVAAQEQTHEVVLGGKTRTIPQGSLSPTLQKELLAEIPLHEAAARVTVRSPRISELPLAKLPKPLEERNAPPSPKMAPLSPYKELRIDGTTNDQVDVRIALPEHASARITVGSASSAQPRGLRVQCGMPSATMTPARWEVIEHLASGGIRFTVVNAWFDRDACSFFEVSRASVEPKPVLGHILYAFRQCDGACETTQTVTIIGPLATWAVGDASGAPLFGGTAPFTTMALDARRGAASAFEAGVSPASLASWFDGNRPSWSSSSKELVLGVDVVQSVNDSEATVLTHVVNPP